MVTVLGLAYAKLRLMHPVRSLSSSRTLLHTYPHNNAMQMEEEDDGAAEGQLLSELSVAHSAAWELAQEVKQLRLQLHAKEVEIAEQQAQQQSCRASMQGLIDTLQAERQELLSTLANMAADNLLREKERLELSKLHKEHAALREELDAARAFLQQQECSVAEVQQALQAAKLSASDLHALHRHMQHAQEHWLPDMERLLHGCAMHETGAALQQEARQRQQASSPRCPRHTTESSTSTDDTEMYNKAARLVQQIAGTRAAGARHPQDAGVCHLENLRAQLLHMQHCLVPKTPGRNKGRNKGSSNSCCTAQPTAIINLLREQQQELLALAHHLAAQAEGAAARVSAQERSVTVLQQQVQDLSAASSHLLQEVPNLQSQLAATQTKLTEQQGTTAALKAKAKQQLEAVVKQNKLLREQLTERHEALQAATQQVQAYSQQHQEVVSGLQQQLQQQQEQLQCKSKQQEVEMQQMRDQLAVGQAASQAAMQRAKAAEHASRALIAVLTKERQEHDKLLVEVQQEMRTQLQAVMEAYAIELQALHEQLIQLESTTPGTSVQSLLSPHICRQGPEIVRPAAAILMDDFRSRDMAVVAAPAPPRSPSLQRLHDSLHQLQHGMGAAGSMEAQVQLQAVQAQLQQAQRREAELLAENTQLCSVLSLYMQQPAVHSTEQPTSIAATHVKTSSPCTPSKGAVSGGVGGAAGRGAGSSPSDGAGCVADLIQTAGVVMNRLDALEDKARMLSNRLVGSPTQSKQASQSLPAQQSAQPVTRAGAAPGQLSSPYKPNELWPPAPESQPQRDALWPPVSVTQQQKDAGAGGLVTAAEMLPLQHEVAAMLAAMQRYSTGNTAGDLQAALLSEGGLPEQPPAEAEQCYHQVPLSFGEVLPRQAEKRHHDQLDLNSGDECDNDLPHVDLDGCDECEDLDQADLNSDTGAEDLGHADTLTAAAEKEQEMAQMLAQSRARYKKLKAKYAKQASQQAALVQALQVQVDKPRPEHVANLDRRAQVSVPQHEHAANLSSRMQPAGAHAVQAGSLAQQQARQKASVAAVRASARPAATAVTHDVQSVNRVMQQYAGDGAARMGTTRQPASVVTSGQVVKLDISQRSQSHTTMRVAGPQLSQLSEPPATRQSSHSSATSSSALLCNEQGKLQNEGSFAFAPSNMLRGPASRQDQHQQRRRQQHPAAAAGASHYDQDGHVLQPDAPAMPVQVRALQTVQQQRATAPKQLPSRFTVQPADGQCVPSTDAAVLQRPRSAVPRHNSRQWQLLIEGRDGSGLGEGSGMGKRQGMGQSSEEGEEGGPDEELRVPAEVLYKAAQYAGDEGLARPSSAAPSSFRAAAAPAPPEVLSHAARYAGQEGQARPASAAPSVLRPQPMVTQQLHAQPRPASAAPSALRMQPHANQHQNQRARAGPPTGLTASHVGHTPAEVEAGSDASSPDGLHSHHQQEYIDGWQRLQQRSSSGASSSINTHGSILSGRSTNLSNLDSAYGGLEHPSRFEADGVQPTSHPSQGVVMQQQAPLSLSVHHEHASATDEGVSATDEGASDTNGGVTDTEEEQQQQQQQQWQQHLGPSDVGEGVTDTEEELQQGAQQWQQHARPSDTDGVISDTEEQQQQQLQWQHHSGPSDIDGGATDTEGEQQQQHGHLHPFQGSAASYEDAVTDEVAEHNSDVHMQPEHEVDPGVRQSHGAHLEPAGGFGVYEEQAQAVHSLHEQHEVEGDEDGHVSDVSDEEHEDTTHGNGMQPVLQEEGLVTDVEQEETEADMEQEPGSSHIGRSEQVPSSAKGKEDEFETVLHQQSEVTADTGVYAASPPRSDALATASVSAHAASGGADDIPASLQTFLS